MVDLSLPDAFSHSQAQDLCASVNPAETCQQNIGFKLYKYHKNYIYLIYLTTQRMSITLLT